jgi:translocation and assembly module TamB
VPYIGWLSSDNGQTNITLKEGQQDIFVSTTVKPHEKTVLPTGKYDARLDVKGSLLDIENFRYQAENGSLSGLAKLNFQLKNSNSHGVQRLKQIISIRKL